MNDPAGLLAIALGIVLGAVAGSFLATLAIRWPQGRSVMLGRSSCDGCGMAIAWWRLIPLASYAGLRGRCAACRAPIDRRQPAMEAICAAIGGVALGLHPDAIGAVGALFGWLLAVLALLDLDHFWLPDRLVAPLALLGLAAGAAGLDPPLVDRLAGGAAGWGSLAAIALAYRRTRGREGLGQGDAKLFGAIGLMLGWRALPWVLLGAAMLGLAWAGLSALRGRRMAGDDRLPLGTLLAVAAWAGWVVVAMS